MTATKFVTTPEYVTIALPPAPIASRLSAGLLDLVLVGLLCTGAASLANWLLPTAIAPAFAITSGFLVLWLYPVWFELRWRGQTPGKRIFALRTVDDRGLPLAPMQCIVRSVARMADVLPAFGGAGLAVCWCDPWHRRLGDLAAGTMVVIERSSDLPPPGLILSLRHSSLDTPRLRRLIRLRLGPEERELLLALLLRAEVLSADARYDLMERTGALLRQRLDAEAVVGLSGEAWVRGIAALCWRAPTLPDRRQPNAG